MLSTHKPTSPSRCPNRSTTRQGCVLPSTETLTFCFVTSMADVKPPGGIRNGLDGGFVHARLVLAQLLPRVLRPRDVLHRVTARVGVVVRESERTKVHSLESLAVRDAERQAEETRFLLTGAAQVDLQRAFREFHVLHECQTDVATDGRITMRFQTHDRPVRAGVGVDHSPAFRVAYALQLGSQAALRE